MCSLTSTSSISSTRSRRPSLSPLVPSAMEPYCTARSYTSVRGKRARNWLLACGVLYAQAPHQHHPPQSADEYAKILEDPARGAWQKPHEVIAALDLKPTDIVADIGAGSGYFARRLAMHAAKVYAVD